jgi:hypothetical protein
MTKQENAVSQDRFFPEKTEFFSAAAAHLFVTYPRRVGNKKKKITLFFFTIFIFQPQPAAGRLRKPAE